MTPRLRLSGGNPAKALARLRAVEAALRFLRSELDDSASEPHLEAFEAAARMPLLEAAAGGGLVPTPELTAQAWRKGAWEEARREACRAFYQDFQVEAARLLAGVKAPLMGLLEEGVERQVIEEVTGRAPAEASAPPFDAAVALQAQFDESLADKLRVEQCLALLHVLVKVARPTLRLQDDFSVLARKLWARRLQHAAQALGAGALLGEPAQAVCRELAESL